jgi:hypothetical protein
MRWVLLNDPDGLRVRRLAYDKNPIDRKDVHSQSACGVGLADLVELGVDAVAEFGSLNCIEVEAAGGQSSPMDLRP